MFVGNASGTRAAYETIYTRKLAQPRLQSMGAHIVILGGGFGGLTAAVTLRSRLGPEHQITVVDRKADFFMGLAKLWVLTGRRGSGEGRRSLTALVDKGIQYVQSEVTRVDVDRNLVETNAGRWAYDYLVIALGAELAPEAVPDFEDGAFNLYDLPQVVRLHEALQRFNAGTILLMVSALPIKCPPAPYEAMFLLDSFLKESAARERVRLVLTTPEPQPIPVAGPEVGAVVRDMLNERDIHYYPGHRPVEVDATRKVVRYENGQSLAYDLLIGVPVHRAPRVVREAGLVDASGWVPVDLLSLRTTRRNVFAVGDVTRVRLSTGALLPKAGMFAEAGALVAAAHIVADLEGRQADETFEGKGACYMEVGGGQAAVVEGRFFPGAPEVRLRSPSSEALQLKREFEAERLRRWF